MLNTAIIGLAAAMVMAAKQETSYLNIKDEAFLIQKTGIVSIVEDEEDIFFGLAAKDNGVTVFYVGDDSWVRSKVKAVTAEDKYDWTFQITGGSADID